MKNLISIIFCTLVLFSSYSYSQETFFSIEAGGIYSSSNIGKMDLEYRPSFSVGTNIEYVENDLLLSIGVKYTNMRFRQNYNNNYNSGPSLSSSPINWKSDYSFHSISIPFVIGYDLLSLSFPKIIMGTEMGLLFDAYEKPIYSFYSCIDCLSINKNGSPNSRIVSRNDKIKIIKDSKGFLNFFIGLAYDYEIFRNKFSSKLMIYLYTDDGSIDSWPHHNSPLEYNKIEFLIGYRF